MTRKRAILVPLSVKIGFYGSAVIALIATVLLMIAGKQEESFAEVMWTAAGVTVAVYAFGIALSSVMAWAFISEHQSSKVAATNESLFGSESTKL